MPSLASIPEGEVLDTSSHQSSSNSEKTNSTAQSSTDSQKTRATARSKLMEETKHIGENLRTLRPQFNNPNNRFSKKVREGNNENFDKWEVLIADAKNCAHWGPKMKSHMNLRLQNPPGKHGKFQVVPRMIFFTQFYRDGFLQRTLREIHNASQAAAE